MAVRAGRREDALAIAHIAACDRRRRRDERAQVRDDRADLLVWRVRRRHLRAGNAAADRLEHAILCRAVREQDGQIGTVHALRVDAMTVAAPQLKQGRTARDGIDSVPRVGSGRRLSCRRPRREEQRDQNGTGTTH